MVPMLPFVDAHVHLWKLSHIRYPWLMPPFTSHRPGGSTEAIAVDYGLGDYLADSARWNVTGIVHVEAGAHPADARRETEWLVSLAARQGLISGIVAFAPLNGPDAGALLEFHAARPLVRGIRHITAWHPNPALTYESEDLITTPAWRNGFALLEKYNLSFDCQVYPAQLASIASLAREHPETLIVIDHLGLPATGNPDELLTWRRGLAALAQLPNTYIKISGVGFIDARWTPNSIRETVLSAVDIFGTKRCMVASDFPTDKLFGSFDNHLSAYHELLAGFSEGERRDMFARNAIEFYRLDLEA